MRSRFGLTGVAATAAMLVAWPAGALDASVDLSTQSAYIWRGMILNDKPVFQPSLTANAGPFSASVWANMDLTADYGHQTEVNEIDYLLTYNREFGLVDLALTAYDYTFPHTEGVSTQELWANVTLKAFGSPSLTVIRDVNAVNGWYFLFTASHDLGLLTSTTSEGLTLTLNLGCATTEYARGYFPEAERDSVTDYGARLDWPLKLGPGELKVNLQWADFAEAHVESPGFEGKRTGLFGGVTYSFSL